MWEVCAGTATLTRSVPPFLSPAAAPSLPVVALWHVAAPHLGLLLMHASHAGRRHQLAAHCLSLWSSRPRGALRGEKAEVGCGIHGWKWEALESRGMQVGLGCRRPGCYCCLHSLAVK